MARRVAVFDVGKTSLKFSLQGGGGEVLFSQTAPNKVIQGPPYPHFDTEEMFFWLKTQLQSVASDPPEAIITVAHGAAGALVRGDGLALPILDYEYSGPATCPYPRPPFSETASPQLPGGLNVGRQLFWQAQTFPDEFARADAYLMYPQFWAFLLCGVRATEVTSLGVHTDLWNPTLKDFSSLVIQQGWRSLFPPLQPAWARLGHLRPEIAQEVGFSQPCAVLCGVHDSNASLVPYLSSESPSVVSSGTWVISMVGNGALDRLDQARDLLAGVNVLGQPVPTARYMGGREFEALLDGSLPDRAEVSWIEEIITQDILAVPGFSHQGGAFRQHRGYFVPERPGSVELRFALASLYSALMIDLQLDWLGSSQSIFLEGSFCKNPFIPGLLAALRPTQTVRVAEESSGTTQGAFLLANWGVEHPTPGKAVPPINCSSLAEYRRHWRERTEEVL
ncbi:hypothetical protein [uncultured Meiothermus sp.]|jgi:sugar (pentulose or hexulose) kinase|uniref:FGGY-family carbohydrate kinase n=1 Tax=uncultured Meiothermus sp. TaxID=157471 RepID=UPI00260F946C|nr:hypothetical protein [uncultured Meiothermus sp.]